MTGIAQILAGTGFGPSSLFTSGAQGAWYDPSDRSTLYQDANGTTPVTAVEQPVRLMLDRSKGLVLGPELVTNGGFDSGTTGWGVAGANVSISGGKVTFTGINSNVRTPPPSTTPILTAGRWYAVTFTIDNGSGGQGLRLDVINSAGSTVNNGTLRTAPGTYTEILQAGAGAYGVLLASYSGFTGTYVADNISVRELPGNHAVAPNDASRPVLRARYNLLTRSEEFNQSPWAPNRLTVAANDQLAPDGTLTADKLNCSVTAAGGMYIWTGGNSITVVANATMTLSAYLKKGSRDLCQVQFTRDTGGGNGALALVNLATGALVSSSTFGTGVTLVGTPTVTDAGGGWYRVALTVTSTGTVANPIIYPSITSGADFSCTSGVDFGYIWGAQLLTAADAAATGNAYQRVGAATDYDTSNPVWRPYLAFDGSDDSFSTSSIDFSGTDEMTVFAGVTKLTNPTGFNDPQIMLELSADRNTNNGAFTVASPADGSVTPTLGYTFPSKGTNNVSAQILTGYPAPVTNVLTGIADISGDVVTLRANGAQIATNTGDQGTGNYGNYPLFIGRRNNTSNPFNGRLYSLAVLGRTATAAEISAMEAWINGKTGAY